MRLHFNVSTKAILSGKEPGEKTISVDPAAMSVEDRVLLERHVAPGSEQSFNLNPFTIDSENVIAELRMFEEQTVRKTAEQRDCHIRNQRTLVDNILKRYGPKDRCEGTALRSLLDAIKEIPDYRSVEVGCFLVTNERNIAEFTRSMTERVLQEVRSLLANANAGGVVASSLLTFEWCPEAKDMVIEANRIVEENIKQNKASKLAAREKWLKTQGQHALLRMEARGYNINRRCKDCVTGLICRSIVRFENLEASLILEDSHLAECRSPSDDAFNAETYILTIPLVTSATVKWSGQREVIEVLVRCPWDESEEDYLRLGVTSPHFRQ